MTLKPIALSVRLPRAMPPVLAVGPFLKNALCLIQGNEAWISRDNGSLDSVAAVKNFEQTAQIFLGLAEEKPLAVAHDLHPDFPSTHYALNSGFKPVAIQHHHAHVAAVMAEHGLDEPVLGLALDGFGLGARGEAWGGELLRVDASGYERLGHLYPLPQPGGDIAARQTWRMGAAALAAIGRTHDIAVRYKDFAGASMVADMLTKGVNCPMTTSAGRLFDAACGLLGVKPIAESEGEAPIALEGLVKKTAVDSDGWSIGEDGAVLDMRPVLARIADLSAPEGAALFHGTFIAALADWAEKAAMKTGIATVALSGGCFYNKFMRTLLARRLTEAGLMPLMNKKVPPGDPCISLGQAWAASLKIEKELKDQQFRNTDIRAT